MCIFNRAAIGFCTVAVWSEQLPSHFQYFEFPEEGGSDALMDFCPLPTPYTNTQCDGSGVAAQLCGSETCRGEVYGAESACFESSLVLDGFVNDLGVGGACYQYRCIDPASASESTTLQVRGGDGLWHSCDGVPA